jgi:hypothetical protein
VTLPDWFAEAGFGLFVHWDHASQQGVEIGWPLVGKSIVPGRTEPEAALTVAEYQASAATFDPKRWDPRAVARLARDSGARYVVFTVRHHAGYSMYHTRQSDFSIEKSPYGGDITREFFDALRAEGLRVGVYYSLLDWNHPDYPAFTDADRPYPHDRYRRPSPEAWARYIAYVKGQLTELLTEVATLKRLGSWLAGHGESVIGARPAPERLDFYGPATQRGNQIYLHLLLRPQEVLVVRNVPIGSVTGVRLLGTEQPLEYRVNEEVHKANGADDEPLGELYITAPPPTGALIDVVAIELSGKDE